MYTYNKSKIVNIGIGIGVTIKELAFRVAETVGYTSDSGFASKYNNDSVLELTSS